VILISLSGLAIAQSDLDNNPCAGKNWGELVANPTYCYRYYVCYLGIANLRTCDDGKIFYSTKKSCVEGNRHTCEIHSHTTHPPTTSHPHSPTHPTRPPTTTQPPTYPPSTTHSYTTTRQHSTTTEAPSRNPCEGKAWAELVANPNYCYRYYACYLQLPTPRQCDSGKVFDASVKRCVEGNPATCEIYSSTTTARPTYPATTTTPTTTTPTTTTPTTTTPTTTTPPSTTEAPSRNPCEGQPWGALVANPNYCYRYYACYLHLPTPRQCDSGKVFDVSVKKCVYGNPHTCEIYTTSPPTTNHPTTRPHTTYPSTTEPHTTYPSTAPPTTHRPTAPPTTHPSTAPPTTLPPSIDDICRNVFFGARPYGNHISLFVGCIREEGIIFTCYPHEHFDRQINECVES